MYRFLFRSSIDLGTVARTGGGTRARVLEGSGGGGVCRNEHASRRALACTTPPEAKVVRYHYGDDENKTSGRRRNRPTRRNKKVGKKARERNTKARKKAGAHRNQTNKQKYGARKRSDLEEPAEESRTRCGRGLAQLRRAHNVKGVAEWARPLVAEGEEGARSDGL